MALCTISLAGTSLAWAQEQTQPPGGRGGGGRGGVGAAGAGRRGPNFPQQTRPLASAEVLARGKAVYGVNCTACHGADLRGGDQGGPSLLRSLAALSDQHGEEIGPIVRGARQDKGMPSFNLAEADIAAVSEYIHSVLAKVGSQARPPGAIDPSSLNVLVGSATAGETYFKGKCASCHSTGGDLKGIGAKYDDPRTLQNTWVAGGAGDGRGGRGGGDGKPSTVIVTLANGEKVEGILIRKDDFIVTLIEKDGTRRSIPRDGDSPKVEVHDPN
ncbi:MAG TPA: cytochrome c, partial [Bryobacteraceae bacterium]